VPFPDYLVLENPVEARRQARNRRIAGFRHAVVDLEFSFGSIVSWRPGQGKRGAYAPKKYVGAATNQTPLISRRVAVFLIVVALITVAAGGGMAYYNQDKVERQHAQDYFKVLYAIKAGEDSRLNACTRIAADWREAAKAGRPFSPRINADEEAKSERIRSEVDKLIQQLQNKPRQNAQAIAKLAELNKVYTDLCAVTSTPPASFEVFETSVGRSQKAFKQKAQELKANLPEKLSKEFEVAKLRYRGLSDL
jgi:hypothetical protein